MRTNCYLLTNRHFYSNGHEIKLSYLVKRLTDGMSMQMCVFINSQPRGYIADHFRQTRMGYRLKNDVPRNKSHQDRMLRQILKQLRLNKTL